MNPDELPDARLTLADLSRKYREILALRAADGPAPRERLRALATEFPGALRELDALPPEVIHARLEELARAASVGEAPPWAQWSMAYHGLMRITLAVKRSLSLGSLDLIAAQSISLAMSARWGSALDEDYVRSLAAPPQGRLGVVVFAALGARFSAAPDALWRSLFPTARPDRFLPLAPR